MSDIFHRLVAPTYFTGGPTFPSESGVTYDYVNNGGSGTPAFADGVKTTGVNSGTYFVAYGDDATSVNANRSALALSQNSDHLDNLLHRSIAASIRTADVTPVSPVSIITLPAGTFLGTAGYTTSVADLNKLFEITDTDDSEIIEAVTDIKISVTSVTLGTGDAIGGGGANGNFSGNTVQLNISPSIPASQAYRIYYGTRANLATLPLDALTAIKVRGANEVSSVIEGLLADLHGNAQAWNEGWDANIHNLAISGLQDRYSRGTLPTLLTAVTPPPAESYWPPFNLDVKGSGGFIIRGGPAVTVYAKDQGIYTDPLNALFAAKFFDQTPSTAGGAVGFASYGARRSGTAFTGEIVGHTPGAGSFAHLWPHYFDASLSTTLPRTRIVNGTSVLLSTVGSFNANTGEAIIQLTSANNYFRSGGFSSLSLGYDLLECIFLISGLPVTRTYVVVAHGSTATPTDATKVRVRNLDGTVPDFSTPVTGTVKWISTTMWMGDGAAEYHQQAFSDVSPSLLSGFFYQSPPLLSTGSEDNIARGTASFSASQVSGASTSLRWGGFSYIDSVSAPLWRGTLNGDGSLNAVGGTFSSDVAITGAHGFSIANGDIVITTGNIELSAGNVGLVNGSVSVLTGNISVLVGNVNVTTGNIATGAGDITAGGSSGAQGAVSGNYVLLTTQTFTNNATATRLVNLANGSLVNIASAVNNQTVTLNITNVRAGGVIVVTLDHTTSGSGSSVSLVWGGSGLTHYHSGSDDQPAPGTGREKWVGHASTASEIYWTVTRY